MKMTERPERIKTRILIISDTHGAKPKPRLETTPSTEDEFSQEDIIRVVTGYREPLPEVDVVLHCGDLTKRTRVPEYQKTFEMLRAISAPLKLAIAGNHDVTLDEDFWVHKWGGSEKDVPLVRKIIDEAKEDGVQYLTEGVHEFNLQNGARLRVFASQYTPSYGGWGFQYRGGHNFDIPPDVDIAMTHGPPQGILDLARMTESHAGCPDLFASIHRAKPKIHCFGHIHEAWGMHLVQWKDNVEGPANAWSAVDTDRSRKLGLADIRPYAPGVDDEEAERRRERLVEMSRQRGMLVDLTEGESRIVEGEQTLFLNAAIMDLRYRASQMPWLVDVELPAAESSNTVV